MHASQVTEAVSAWSLRLALVAVTLAVCDTLEPQEPRRHLIEAPALCVVDKDDAATLCCLGEVCAATCDDGLRKGDQTDVDCRSDTSDDGPLDTTCANGARGCASSAERSRQTRPPCGRTPNPGIGVGVGHD